MSPVAVSPSLSASADDGYAAVGSVKGGAVGDIPRRPSPWHEIAHSLSATPVISRRASSPHVAPIPTPITIDQSPNTASGSPGLSTSQALREWEERLLSPESDVQRHQLVHPPSSTPTPTLQAHLLVSSRGSPALPPKLAAERDKEGHIEYKLKLIDPSPERFGRLVTQMMWRLKQGKNEAIYELGLAGEWARICRQGGALFADRKDDGTVVGLTRPEMDASLRTLELMASEVGATVMILREIVLSAHPPLDMNYESPGCSDISSSAISLSSSTYSSHDGGDAYRWPVKRPDLDQNGQPRKGSKSLGTSLGPDSGGKLVKKTSKDYAKGQQVRVGKQVIFDPQDMEDGETDDEQDSMVSESAARRGQRSPSNTDDDIPPFHLDLDEPTHGSPLHQASDSWHHVHKSLKTGTTFTTPTSSSRKSEAKRLQSAKKREARRMDLLRGDGTSPLWTDLHTSVPMEKDVAASLTHPPPPPISARLPHQPARPSSLRLASPAPESSSISPDDRDNEDDAALWSLSHIPLDSLSLSFANVQIEDISPPSSPSSETEYAMPLHDDHPGIYSPNNTRPPSGEEMICVEALVVRKVQHGHGADGDGTDEEECAWGGEDDGWGFGVDDD